VEAIISHVGADFDGLASMVAARKLYPQARLFFAGPPEQGVRDFMNLYKDFFPVDTPRDPGKLPLKRLILVDCRNPSRFGSFSHLVSNPQMELHVYDHHPPSQQDIKGDVNVIEEVGASTTILVKMLVEKNIYLTPMEATLMALGIYEETGSLLFKSTTPDDAAAVAELLRRGVNLSVVSDYIFHYLNDEQRKLLNELISSSQVLSINGFKVLVARSSCDKYVDGLALVTHRLHDLERMDAVFTVVEMSGRTYMVARSIRLAIDVSRITRFFGGGGHPTASSAVIRNMPPAQVEQKLKSVLKRSIKPQLRAADIMSTPVKTLELRPDMSMKEAFEHMHRLGHFHLPIIKDGRLEGIIERRDIDKAEHHGYGNAPLEVYMSRPVITTNPDASIFHLQNMMMEKGIGCLPVLNGSALVGIVTRSDVLEAVYRREMDGMHSKKRPLDQIKKLPRFLRDILKTCGRVGDRLHVSVYAVGGFVRDLLMEVENLDIDLVVEGDGMLFGESLARMLKGKAKVHEKFGTSTVALPGGMHVDVATSRTEYYTRPAALPEVMESSIKQDLYRRDFTINAMALRLNRKFFGELLDFFGCRKDLRSGIVKVLHPMSFVDDPTRILRAVKFEQRFHFRMDQATENLLKDALASNAFKGVSSERIRNELLEILEEPRPLAAIRRMDQLRILRIISPGLSLDSRMVEIIESITATLVQFDAIVKREEVTRWILYFNALVMRLEPAEIREIADRFKVSSAIASRASFDRDQVHAIIRTLCSRTLAPSELYRSLDGLKIETLLFLMARTRMRIVRSRIVHFINTLRHVKPVITGSELKRWGVEPGPAYKKILAALLDAQLDRRFSSPEGAREFFQQRLSPLCPPLGKGEK